MFGVSPRIFWPLPKATNLKAASALAFPRATLAAQVAVQLAMLVAVFGLAGCGSSPINRAPVEDRGTSASASRPAVAAAPVAPPVAAAGATPAPGAGPTPLPPLGKTLLGAENEGKPGYYTVKPGDTLIRIGLDNGQNWRDVVRWNAIDNPNQIEVGQVLRVQPPVASAPPLVAAAPSSAASAPAGAASGAVTRPVATPSAAAGTPVVPGTAGQAASAPRPAGPAGAAGTVVAAAPATAAPASSSAAGVVAPAANGDEDIAWMWPASGTVLAGFDEVKNKGVDIGGTVGTPVVAAADGRVVYVGAGLRGYGNLIILKHNNTYLTAYAHNQTLLVKEDQSVRRGQKIAEMGNSDSEKVKLHFEIRRQGKPVDPAKYLPPK